MIVAKPVSRLFAQEILEISCLTCRTNCAGEVFAINQSTNKKESEHKNDLMTNETSLCQKITILPLFILPKRDLAFIPLNCKLKNYLNKIFCFIYFTHA